MIIPVNGPAAKRWPFVASLPTHKHPVVCAVAAPASGGSGEARQTHIVQAFRRANPELARALDLLRAAA